MTVVGLDVGTTSLKGIALGDGGQVLAVTESPYDVLTPRPGWSEQDPDEWVLAAERVLAELEQRAGPAKGIGLSGQMHGLVALDAEDRVLRPALLWNDQRTVSETSEVEQLVGGRQQLIAATGNRALTGFTATKLLWMSRNEPELYQRLAHVMLPKDYVRLRLCGEHATDVTDASGTLWFDVSRREWSDAVIGALQMDADWLPFALESAAVSGVTSSGIPIAAGAGDQAAGALGVGALAPGTLSVVLGTSGVVFAPQESYRADPDGALQLSCHVIDDAWFAMGVMLSAAGSLAWLSRACGASPADLVAEAERWPPGAEGLLFLPYLSGERAPHHDPGARGAFVGLSGRHDRGALARAVLEGVAFALRDLLDLVAPLAGEAIVARVSGGGARSDLWLRILASVLDVPLQRPVLEEGAAFGAALLGGVAAGVWRSPAEAAEACVEVRSVVEPEAEWTSAYAEPRERFAGLYEVVAGS